MRARLGQPELAARIADWFRTHGVPDEITEELIGSGDVYRPFIRFQRDPILVDDGDRSTAGSSSPPPATPTASSASSDRVLVSADHLLGRISPTVGLWPASRPDPLGDFLESLDGRSSWRPRSRCPGTATRSPTLSGAPTS